MNRIVIAVACSVLALCGCGRDEGSARPAADRSSNVASDAVDVITQRKTIQAGQRARKQIEDLSRQHNAELEQALEQ